MSDELTVKQPASMMEVPDYVKSGSKKGLENTKQDDILIPRLSLAQALSPQVTEGDPRRIPDLKVGDLFNSVTNQVYGRDIQVQLICKLPMRAIEFNSIDEGGGIKDMNVPLDDERCKWHGTDKPVATIFREFLAVLLPSRELICLSFKSTGLKVAKQLWGLVVMRGRDVYAGKFRLTTAVSLVPKPHQIFKVDNAGWVSKEDFLLGAEDHERMKDIDLTRIDLQDADLDFDPEALEQEAAGTPATDSM